MQLSVSIAGLAFLDLPIFQKCIDQHAVLSSSSSSIIIIIIIIYLHSMQK